MFRAGMNIKWNNSSPQWKRIYINFPSLHLHESTYRIGIGCRTPSQFTAKINYVLVSKDYFAVMTIVAFDNHALYDCLINGQKASWSKQGLYFSFCLLTEMNLHHTYHTKQKQFMKEATIVHNNQLFKPKAYLIEAISINFTKH